MSDHAVQRSDCSEGQMLLSSKTGGRESSYQSRWLSRWRQTGTSSSSQALKHHVISGIDDRTQKKEQRYFLTDGMKSNEANTVSMDMKTKNSFECTTVQRYDPKELSLTSDVPQSIQILGDNNKENIRKSSVVLKNVNSIDSKAVLSSNYDNLLEYPEDEKSFTGYHSENVGHFPMFDINRKIQSILAPKEKVDHGSMSARMTEPHLLIGNSGLTPCVMEFASEEHRFEAGGISQSAELEGRPKKSIKSFPTYEDEHSNLAVHRFECNRSKRTSCLCNREETDPFIYREHFARTGLTYLNREMDNCCNHFISMSSKTKNYSGMVGNSFGSNCPGLKTGSKQALRGFGPPYVAESFLAGEHGKQIGYAFGNDLLSIDEASHESRKFDNSGCKCKMPMWSLHDVNALGECNGLHFLDTTKAKPCRFSNETKYLLNTQKMGMDMSPGDQMIRQSTLSAEVKGTALVEMPTLASMSHHHVGNTQSPIVLTNGEEEGIFRNDIRFTYTPDKSSNKTSNKTDTAHINIPLRAASPAGRITSNFKMGMNSHTFTKSEQKTSSLLHQSFCRNATFSGVREVSTSGTESIGVNHNLSYFENPDDSSNPLQEIPSSLEQIPRLCMPDNNINHPENSEFYSGESSRWVKLRRHNPLDSLALSAKRFKTGDDPYRGEERNSPSKMLDCTDSSFDSTEHPEEQEEADNSSLLIKDIDHSLGESKAIKLWISRWCHGTQPEASHRKPETAVLCEPPENSKATQGSYEAKHFPSITAMAMMGKASKNFRPRQIQTKGSVMVWRT